MNKTALIYRKLSGTASNREIRALDEWLRRDVANKKMFADLEAYWIAASEPQGKSPDQFYLGLFRIGMKTQQKVSQRKKRVTMLWAALLVLAMAANAYIILYERGRFNAPPPILRFDESTVGEVAARLEQGFDIRIRIEDSVLLSRRLTGSFFSADGAEGLLEPVCRSLDLEWEPVAENTYRIRAAEKTAVGK